ASTPARGAESSAQLLRRARDRGRDTRRPSPPHRGARRERTDWRRGGRSPKDRASSLVAKQDRSPIEGCTSLGPLCTDSCFFKIQVTPFHTRAATRAASATSSESLEGTSAA